MSTAGRFFHIWSALVPSPLIADLRMTDLPSPDDNGRANAADESTRPDFAERGRIDTAPGQADTERQLAPTSPEAIAPPPIIATTRLTKRFSPGGADILSSIDVTVRRGEAVAIVGANGAGKSTLLKCLVGLEALSGGEVDIFGERFSRQPTASQRRRLRRNIGFVFQFHGLVARLSALSNVVHGALGQGYGPRAWHQTLAPSDLRAHAMHGLDRVGLADRAHDRAGTLSGGQSQRVAIARAIVHAPALLIADEPVASLDPAAGTDIMRLFRSLAGGAVSLVYTTHNVEHALAYADRVIAMRHGAVAFEAPADDLTPGDIAGIYGA